MWKVPCRPTAQRRALNRMVLNRAKTGHTGQGSPSDPSLPVFVDASGRRARNLRRTGYGLAACAATYMAVLGLSLMGATPFAPGAILPGDIAAPAAPEPRTPGRTPLAPPDGPSVAVGPSTLIVPQLTAPGPPLAPPLVPGSPPNSAPAPPDTPEPRHQRHRRHSHRRSPRPLMTLPLPPLHPARAALPPRLRPCPHLLRRAAPHRHLTRRRQRRHPLHRHPPRRHLSRRRQRRHPPPSPQGRRPSPRHRPVPWPNPRLPTHRWPRPPDAAAP